MSEYNINAQATLLERAKRSVDGKTILPVLDVMQKLGTEAFLQDVPFYPANMGLKHRVSRTTSRPTSTRRVFYSGVPKTGVQSQLIWEPVALFEQRSGVDEDELDTVTNPDEYRRSLDEPHAAGILDDFIYSMFNESRQTGGEYMDGIASRLDTISNPEATATDVPYVWDNGGENDLCSLYIVEWGPRAVHALYPGAGAVRGGGPFGMSIRNKGKEVTDDSANSALKYYEYITQFKFWYGMAVWDDWKIARIANIDKDETSAGALNDNLVIKALVHGKFNKGATRIYGNPFLTAQIEIRAKDKGNTQWGTKEVFGSEIPSIRGIPYRTLDDTILSDDETQVTA